MKKRVLFALIMGVAFLGDAKPISQGQAERAVQAYLSQNPSPMESRIGTRPRHTRTFNRAQRDTPLFHVVALEGGGFVVTSADTDITPIIAISEGEDLVESKESQLWVLLNRDLSQRMEALEAPAAAGGGGVSVPSLQWADLLAGKEAPGDDAPMAMAAAVSVISDVRVEPLIQSKWNQSTVSGKNVYNYYTPNNYLCGCVATAGAQIMRYHQFPTASVEAKTYTCWVNGVTQDLTMKGGVYDWANMPLHPTSSITDAQREAIGRLTYDASVTARMRYTQSESWAYYVDMKDGFREAFGYASASMYETPSSSSPSISTHVRNAVLAALDAGLPVLLGIYNDASSGHAIIADGYGYHFGVMYAHLNMGWGGSDDAWYNMEALNVSSRNYNHFGYVTYNISPTQTGEWISGRTLNNIGVALSGATVVARNIANGTTYTATSNTKGVYAIKVPSVTATYGVSATNGTQIATELTVPVSASSPQTVGNRWGNDLILRTEPALPSPIGLSASKGAYPDRVALTWTAAAGATSYHVYRGVSGTIGNATRIGTTTSTFYDDMTVTLGTTYYYWVQASANVGESDFSAGDFGYCEVSLGEALNNTMLSWTTSGAASWFAQTTTTHDGAIALQSGVISHNQQSIVQTSVTGPGTLTFWWRVSSERDYDELKFYVGGTKRDAISGSRQWAQKTVPVPAGIHVLKWSYEKDFSVDSASDCGWLDQVTWVPTPTVTFDGNGGTPSSQGVMQAYGSPYILPAVEPEQAGHIFDGWFTARTGGTQVTAATTVAQATNHTVYAQWQAASEYQIWLSRHGLPATPGNYDKWLVNPQDTNAVFRAAIEIRGGMPHVSWTPDLGAARVYTIEGTPDLTAPAWTEVAPTAMPATPMHFFRVRVEEAP